MGEFSVVRLDHRVLTIRDIGVTVAFHETAVGMKGVRFRAYDGTTRWALLFGRQRFNLHEAGAEFEPKATVPTPGSPDLCFLSATPLDKWQTHLEKLGIDLRLGPQRQTGAHRPILSIYLRDPNGNLIGVANQL